jgi:uncharacterized membrane protein
MNDIQQEVSMQHQSPQPTIGGAFREGWQTLWMDLPRLLIIWLIYIAVGLTGVLGVHYLFGDGIGNDISSGLVSMLFSILVSWPLFFGLCKLFLNIVRRREVQVGQIFDGFLRLPSIVFAAIIITVSTTVGLIFFVVPGVIIFCKLILTPFLMMDKDLNGWDAVALSWQITSGHTGQIILIVMLAGCIMFMGMLLFGIGIIPAWIWVVLTIASFYNTLTAERD